MADPAPPVILLVFARSEGPRFEALPRLPEEARLLRKALEPAEDAGQIKLEIRPDATLDDILDAFNRFRNRVIIFHFAGHTDDQSLLAEQLLGAEALLAVVHAQTELKLVFLNACENQAQAAGLHAAGVPAAIVTSEEVEDDLCPDFAVRFYSSLASGFTLAEAFTKARMAAEGEAYMRPGRFDHGPWLLSMPDPAAGAWRLPPARSRRSGPIPLQKPLRIQHFTGRERELAKLLEDLQPGKTVTLCGAGGMGKSALAVEAIWTLAPGDEPPIRFPDGIIFHTFYHQPQAEAALEAIVRSLGAEPRPSPRDAARLVLASRRALLVLDGAEAADDLDAILSVAGSCGVVVTTRRQSDALADFQSIEPLPSIESLQLLRSWAGPYAADEPAAIEIVRLLGGMPLALFLVGRYLARCQQLSEDYAAWLREQGLAALHFDDRPSKSIPLLLAHSLAQVDETAQAAFGVAGVLALAPFSADPIAAALQLTTAAAHHALAKLVDIGMLQRSDESYQVTHALAHTYARVHVASNAEIINRLAIYYANLVETESVKGLSGYIALDSQRAHIIAVQALALKAEQWDAVRQITWNSEQYLTLSGYSSESLSVIEAGLAAARASRARYDEAAFLSQLGNWYNQKGKLSRAIELYEERLEIAREMGDRRGEGGSLSNLGAVYANLGEFHRAIDLYTQALEIMREIGDRSSESKILGNLGVAFAGLGNFGSAIKMHNEQLTIVRKIGDRIGQAAALGNLGDAYGALGNFSDAIKLRRRQLIMVRKSGDRIEEAAALNSIGNCYAGLGKVRRAIKLYEQGLGIVREIGYRRGEAASLGNLGNAYADLGELHKAVELEKQALEIMREIGDRHGEAITSWNLGLTYKIAGDLALAISNMQIRVVYEQELGHPEATSHAQQVLELKTRACL